MRLIITSFLVTAACKAGGRNAARGRTRKATIRTWESRSLAISTAKIIPREKRGRLNRRKSRLLPWFNFAAGLRTATTSPCNISCVTVILPARDVQVTGSRSARFYSNSRAPRPKAQSREIDDTVEVPFHIAGVGGIADDCSRSRAQAVQRDVSSVRRARMPSDASAAGQRLEEHLVSLVMQFQATAGGYAATHCLPGTRICCQPKRSQDLLPGEQIACKWVCVSSARACGGFLGPRIPQSGSK